MPSMSIKIAILSIITIFSSLRRLRITAWYDILKLNQLSDTVLRIRKLWCSWSLQPTIQSISSLRQIRAINRKRNISNKIHCTQLTTANHRQWHSRPYAWGTQQQYIKSKTVEEIHNSDFQLEIRNKHSAPYQSLLLRKETTSLQEWSYESSLKPECLNTPNSRDKHTHIYRQYGYW